MKFEIKQNKITKFKKIWNTKYEICWKKIWIKKTSFVTKNFENKIWQISKNQTFLKQKYEIIWKLFGNTNLENEPCRRKSCITSFRKNIPTSSFTRPTLIINKSLHITNFHICCCCEKKSIDYNGIVDGCNMYLTSTFYISCW